MPEAPPTKPPAPDLPTYLRDPLERQSPARLETVAEYAEALAEWKRQRRDAEAAQRQAADAVDADTLDALEDQDVSTDPADYEDVPRKAYITVKEPKPGYRYYYWQWRDGDTWNNKYIAPVNPRE